MYFECNIPMTMPDHMHISLLKEYNDMAKRIFSRMEKLNDALEITGLDGATFSKLAKVMFDRFFDKFEAMSPEALASFVMTVYDGTTAEPRMEWPNVNVVVDTAFVLTKEWELLRGLSIGGSEAAIVMGISPYRTKRELYHDKCCTPVAIPEDKPEAIFARGHFLEEEVVRAFCELTGAKRIPETRMFVSKTHPHSTANVDQFICFPDGRIYIYEAKTTIEDNFMPWVNNKIPPQYVTQMRQYPAVMADDRICGTYIGCLFTKDFALNGTYLGSTFDESRFLSRLVDRDPEDEEEILAAETDFWNTYIEPGNEPPPEGKVATSESASDIEVFRRYSGFADKSAPVLELQHDDFGDDIKEYLALGEERSVLEAKARGLKERQGQLTQRLIEALGPTVDGEVRISDTEYYEVRHYPKQAVKVDKEKLEIAFPDAFAACVTHDPEASRIFSLKKKEYSKKKKKK